MILTKVHWGELKNEAEAVRQARSWNALAIFISPKSSVYSFFFSGKKNDTIAGLKLHNIYKSKVKR